MWTGAYADIGTAHAVMTDNDLVLVDQSGVVRSLVADSGCRRALLADVWANSALASQKTQVRFSPARREVYVCCSDIAGMSDAWTVIWTLHLDSGKWGRYVRSGGTDRAMGTVAWDNIAGRPVNRDVTLVCASGAESALNQVRVKWFDADAQAEDANPSTWAVTGISLGDPARRTLCRGVRLRGNGPAATETMEVRVGSRAGQDGAYTFGAWQVWGSFVQGGAGVFAEGHWLAVEVRCQTPNSASGYRLTGVELDLVPSGKAI
jgi:hypothetical protein